MSLLAVDEKGAPFRITGIEEAAPPAVGYRQGFIDGYSAAVKRIASAMDWMWVDSYFAENVKLGAVVSAADRCGDKVREIGQDRP